MVSLPQTRSKFPWSAFVVFQESGERFGGRLLPAGIRLEARHANDRSDRRRQGQDPPESPAAVASYWGFSNR
ncbi:hypothetical protein, partial [Azospirillum sp. B506]|uniref:hypothetical protein n=1 Tax=Azospirillum sp. B506 TaxID=137721 RepID=UPI001B3BF4B1